MSSAIKIYQGRFGRVALLDMDAPLVQHAHHHCHLLIKAAGPDTFFAVQDEMQPLSAETAVLVNPWESHAYKHNGNQEQHTVILAMYIEPDWLAQLQHPVGGSGHPQFFPHPCVKMSERARKLSEELALEMWWSDSIASERLEGLLCELMISVVDPDRSWRDLSWSSPTGARAIHAYARRSRGFARTRGPSRT